MAGTPTLAYNIVKRNGSTLTSPVNAAWGSYNGSGTFSDTDPATWEQLLIHPYESAGTYRAAPSTNTDYYDIELAATPNVGRGKEIVKRSYGVWNAVGSVYNYSIENIKDIAWPGNDVISHQIDVDVDLLDTTAHTFVFVINGPESDFVDDITALHDYKPVVVQIMPEVDINSHTLDSIPTGYKLNETTDDKVRFNATVNNGPYSIDFMIKHSHCNGSTSTEGVGAWVWYKGGTFKSEDITWGSGTQSTGNLTVDNETVGGTYTYILELFIYNGLKSNFDTNNTSYDNPRIDGLSYDRRIIVDVIYA